MTGPHYRFTMITKTVIRCEWSSGGIFEDRASTFAICRNFPKPAFRVHDVADQLEIVSKTFHMTYDKKSFSANGLHVTFPGKMTE